jgi:hypothetical protein
VRTAEYAAVTAAALTVALVMSSFAAHVWSMAVLHMPF